MRLFCYHQLSMKQAVFRERNKRYYRVLHTPIWIWVFWVLPGWPLTYDLYTHGPDRRHWIWLAIVLAGVVWRGLAGRLPGCEPRPYITHYGVHQPNLPYRVVCYTAAWIDIIVPYALNLIGLIVASIDGRWLLHDLYRYGYYPLALAVVLATVFDWTPRARRDTFGEGAERAWFYVAIWTVVPDTGDQLGRMALWQVHGPAAAAAGPPQAGHLPALDGAVFLSGLCREAAPQPATL